MSKRAKKVGRGIVNVGKGLYNYLKSTGNNLLKAGDATKDFASGHPGAVKEGWKAVGSQVRAVKALIKSVKNANDKRWYIKYCDITPAANYNRPMDPLFNTSITQSAGTGSTCKYIDVNLDWTGYSSTFMFDNIVSSSFRQLRAYLKSNLPYKEGALKAYYIQSIALAIMGKQLERNIHWNSFSSPEHWDFPKMWKLTTNTTSYGVRDLEPIEYLSEDYGEWSKTIADYEILTGSFNTCVLIPHDLGLFISHYFGTVFTDSGDGYNDQIIRLNMNNVDWATYDEGTDTVHVSTINVSQVTPKDMIKLLNSYKRFSAIVLADLLNSGQMNPMGLIPYDGSYQYAFVYDTTLLQALINGYTDSSAVTDKGYLRLDQMSGVSDDLTQYIMMGAIQNWEGFKYASETTNVPALTLKNMVLKYNSDDSLKWPSAIDQGIENVQSVSRPTPFGIVLVTSIQSDTYSAVDVGVASVSGAYGTQAAQVEYTNLGNDFKANIAVTGSQSTLMSKQFGVPFVVDAFLQTLLIPTICTIEANYLTNQVEYVGKAFMLATALNKQQSNKSYKVTETKPCIIRYTAKSESMSQDALKAARSQVIAYLSNISSQMITSAVTFENLNAGSSYDGIYGSIPANSITVPFQVLAVDTTNIKGTYNLDYYIDYYNINNSSSISLRAIVPNTKDAIYFIGYNTLGASFTPQDSISIAEAYQGWASGTLWSNDLKDGAVGNRMVTTIGFSGLAAWAADSFDYHIPMLQRNRSTVEIKSTSYNNTLVVDAGDFLIKEAYIPYYYNVIDLVPVLYNMMLSLFSPFNIYDIQNYKKKRTNKPGNDKPDSDKSK